ncbi:MAG: uroporphyrinogen decarboxylase [Pseudomonadota bacterium]
MTKPLLAALGGTKQPVPPVWMMRQAGRYLPEYRATRARAGDFLSLCYNSDLATEVTLQPIRRYEFDAAILFADILLVPQALGADLWFVTGEGPRLSTVTGGRDLGRLGSADDIHDTLAPIYQTLRNLADALPQETTLIGFAGAPWTVATYMIEGRGTPDKAGALRLMAEDRATFDGLMDRLTEATIRYLSRQIEAGAEVVKLFDSWAGALPPEAFDRYCIAPHQRIVEALAKAHPAVPVIGFPRGASREGYEAYRKAVAVPGIAIDTDTDATWAAGALQPHVCVQGNLDQRLLVSGGAELMAATRRVVETFAGGPHIFNLGHGITPDANPDHVSQMLDTIRSPARAEV